MIVRVCFLYCSLSFSLLSFAQCNIIDSLKRDLEIAKGDTNKVSTLIWLSEELKNTDPLSALGYARNARVLAARLNNYRVEAIALRNLGDAYERSGNDLEAFNYLDSSLQEFQPHNDKHDFSVMPRRACATDKCASAEEDESNGADFVVLVRSK